MRMPVLRKENRFLPDSRRVIIRYFENSPERCISLVKKIVQMPETEAKAALMATLREFSRRHRNITKKFLIHYDKAQSLLKHYGYDSGDLSRTKQLLIGSFFSLEYSIESAAFFNPSMVESPDQSALEDGSKRLIVSFRATGEGHISSMVFRSGIIDKNGDMSFQIAGRYIEEAEIIKRTQYDKSSFTEKLREMELAEEIISTVLNKLNDTFIYGELLGAIEEALYDNNGSSSHKKKQIQEIVWLADSHYEIDFSKDTDISERVIFPISYSERKGIEDARFVKFKQDDGEVVYYATYTAYDGRAILPKLIETKDFYHFQIRPLHGKGAQNKNLALFPRKIKGKYAMLSRIDGINSYICFSDKVNFWNKPEKLYSPKHYWEYIQIGNCGSPIETEEGWIVINHGVGPVRQYSLSASLLDLDDPRREIGRLSEPIISPNEEEREGYVPNVVYSCGAIRHEKWIVIPYGMSDTASGVALLETAELIKRLKA